MIPGLGQVIDNLIDNARSFSPGRQHGCASPVGGQSRTSRSSSTTMAGVPNEAVEKIFERFYTHRPDQDFRPKLGPRPLHLEAYRRSP